MSGPRRRRVRHVCLRAGGGAVRGGEDAAAEGEDLNGEAYRRKIEALKQDMGDGWLKAFSQSQAVS